MRSAIALRDVVRRRLRGASSSLSRTTSDFEILRPRDSASMSATNGSGKRTVRVFIFRVYYICGGYARHGWVEQGQTAVRYRISKWLVPIVGTRCGTFDTNS